MFQLIFGLNSIDINEPGIAISAIIFGILAVIFWKFMVIVVTSVLGSISLSIGTGNIYNTGFVILLILVVSSCVISTIVLGGDIEDFTFLMEVISYVYWIVLIFLFVMSIVLFFIRKVKSKKYRRMGYGIVIILFGTVFHVCHYIIAREIAWAIAATYIINR